MNETKNKGGRPRKLAVGEAWKNVPVNMTADEKQEYDLLKGKRSNREFFKILIMIFKMRKKRHASN